MGYYVYPPLPGSLYGPCRNTCDHSDCRKSREDAASLCRICNEPIGYGHEIYFEKTGLVHAPCLWKEVESATLDRKLRDNRG